MRTTQVSISVYRFGNQFAIGREMTGKEWHHRSQRKDLAGIAQRVGVYADANNFYEALCSAFYEITTAIQCCDKLPKRESDEQLATGGNNEVEIFVSHIGHERNDNPEIHKISETLGSPLKLRFSAASENAHEALATVFAMVLQEIQQYTTLPYFGRRSSGDSHSREGKPHTGLDCHLWEDL
jgi:uncharacterized MAPEG superfamily protein